MIEGVRIVFEWGGDAGPSSVSLLSNSGISGGLNRTNESVHANSIAREIPLLKQPVIYRVTSGNCLSDGTLRNKQEDLSSARRSKNVRNDGLVVISNFKTSPIGNINTKLYAGKDCPRIEGIHGKAFYGY